MPGLVALPNAALALSRPAPAARRRGKESERPCARGFGRPVQNGRECHRKGLKRLNLRPEMAWSRKLGAPGAAVAFVSRPREAQRAAGSGGCKTAGNVIAKA